MRKGADLSNKLTLIQIKTMRFFTQSMVKTDFARLIRESKMRKKAQLMGSLLLTTSKHLATLIYSAAKTISKCFCFQKAKDP